jgi:hypothetical protein
MLSISQDFRRLNRRRRECTHRLGDGPKGRLITYQSILHVQTHYHLDAVIGHASLFAAPWNLTTLWSSWLGDSDCPAEDRFEARASCCQTTSCNDH